jgi:hypothetical protein
MQYFIRDNCVYFIDGPMVATDFEITPLQGIVYIKDKDVIRLDDKEAEAAINYLIEELYRLSKVARKSLNKGG